jgi:hypothetical protein
MIAVDDDRRDGEGLMYPFLACGNIAASFERERVADTMTFKCVGQFQSVIKPYFFVSKVC